MQHCSSAWLIIKLAGVEIQLARLNPQCYGKRSHREEALGLNQILTGVSIQTYSCQIIYIAVVSVNKSPNHLDD